MVQIEYLNLHHKELVAEIRKAMMSAKGTAAAAANLEGSLGSMEATSSSNSSSNGGGDSGGNEVSSRLGASKNGGSNATGAAAAPAATTASGAGGSGGAAAGGGGGGAASGSVSGVISDKTVALAPAAVAGGIAEVDRPLILATIMPAGADQLPMTVRSEVDSYLLVFEMYRDAGRTQSRSRRPYLLLKKGRSYQYVLIECLIHFSFLDSLPISSCSSFFPPLIIQVPPDPIVERIHLVFNNVSMQNLEVKAAETKSVLSPAYVTWFGNYLVVKRISTQPNFHALYLAFLFKLDTPALLTAVLAAAFHSVSKLLGSEKITTSTSERSLLKNLGSWLGQMTLARNKPIMQRKLDVKELLCQGYETGRLIAVTPFVAKIMEGAKDSRVFRAPNPWTMALMGLLRELYEMDDLKMNIKFEIEVLCKHLSLKIDDVPPQRVLGHTRLQPHKDKTPDFNVRPSALSQQQQAAAVAAERQKGGNVNDNGDAGGVLRQQQAPSTNLQQPPPLPQGGAAAAGLAPLSSPISHLSGDSSKVGSGVGGAARPPVAPLGLPPATGGNAGGDGASGLAGLPTGLGVGVVPSEQTVIPNLGAYVTVHPSLSVFHGAGGGALKAVVPVAVDRAIREIIQPVRSMFFFLRARCPRIKFPKTHAFICFTNLILFCTFSALFFSSPCACSSLRFLKTGGGAVGDHCLHHQQGARREGLRAGRLRSQDAERGPAHGGESCWLSGCGHLQGAASLEHGHPSEDLADGRRHDSAAAGGGRRRRQRCTTPCSARGLRREPRTSRADGRNRQLGAGVPFDREGRYRSGDPRRRGVSLETARGTSAGGAAEPGQQQWRGSCVRGPEFRGKAVPQRPTQRAPPIPHGPDPRTAHGVQGV